jgi:hypothetical protein
VSPEPPGRRARGPHGDDGQPAGGDGHHPTDRGDPTGPVGRRPPSIGKGRPVLGRAGAGLLLRRDVERPVDPPGAGGTTGQEIRGRGDGGGAEDGGHECLAETAPTRGDLLQEAGDDHRRHQASSAHGQAGQRVTPLVVAAGGTPLGRPPAEYQVLDRHAGEVEGHGDDGEVLGTAAGLTHAVHCAAPWAVPSTATGPVGGEMPQPSGMAGRWQRLTGEIRLDGTAGSVVPGE